MLHYITLLRARAAERREDDSASAMSDHLLLPPDIWYQILTKVAAKSIPRCRCVSKAWYSLISSPNFISDHTAQTLKQTRNRVLVHTCDINNGHCKFTSHDESFLEPSHEHDDVPQRLEIIGCCAGLFCLAGYYATTGIDGSVNQVQRFLLWNPSIRRIVELPSSSSCSSEEVRYLLGFGFDSNSSDFKVTRVVYRQSGDLVPVVSEIFDVRTGAWRRLSPPVTPSPFHYGKRCLEVIHYHSCADLNGTLHWMANEYSSNCFLLSFDLSSEVFRVMETPDGIEFKGDDDFTKVLSIDGLLSVALLTKQQQGDCFSVWSMKEYGNSESWTKLFHIELPGSLSLSTVFGFREKGEVVILPLWENDNNFEDLVLYNLKSRKYEAVLSTNGFINSAWLYVESLVLL